MSFIGVKNMADKKVYLVKSEDGALHLQKPFDVKMVELTLEELELMKKMLKPEIIGLQLWNKRKNLLKKLEKVK